MFNKESERIKRMLEVVERHLYKLDERIETVESFLKKRNDITKLRKNRNSEIFCQTCETIIKLHIDEASKLCYCPHCGARIVECKFDN